MPGLIASTREALVAEDDPVLRGLLVEILGRRGLACTAAADGSAAVRALERSRGRVRLVLTDLDMPGVDGLAVIAAARTANPYCYVVVLTGHTGRDIATRAAQAGAAECLTKPFSIRDVHGVLDRAAGALDGRRPD